MNTKMTKKEFDKLLADKLFSEFSVDFGSATDEQIYRALALIVRGMLSAKRKRFMSRTYGANGKQVYYLCMEFLMGRSLKTSLFNMGLADVAEAVLKSHDIRLDNIYEQEPDAGLGNGGLGRLAACYLDGMATDDIPGMGYSILYEYGIFKQKIVDGWQEEHRQLAARRRRMAEKPPRPAVEVRLTARSKRAGTVVPLCEAQKLFQCAGRAQRHVRGRVRQRRRLEAAPVARQGPRL
ncbi:MAG: glycogen/starch/alpha-glucan phosphorylase [Ruthenibacterium sp.]